MLQRPKTVLARPAGKEEASAFDAFVRASPFAAYQQTRAFADCAPRKARHAYLTFICEAEGEIVGTAVVRLTRLAPGAALATIQRGPVVADPALLGPVVEALKDALRRSGCCTLVLGPRFAGEARDEAAEALAGIGFRALPKASQALHTVTGKIALDAPAEAILAGFKQRGRRAIRRVAESGVSVRDATPDDLQACRDLIETFHARRPGYDSSGQLGVDAQARLIEAEGGGMLVAEAEGRIVGWHSFVRQGRDAIWLAMATDDDPKAPRSYLLLWEAVRRARALGLSAFDLAGLSGGDASGRDQFKQAFAPVREELLPAHVAPLRPIRHALFFGARQLYRARRGRG
jgi:lipid II:glycine glycyltransferase (peptidoglycan interpeptide bridge formation enzyme)